MTTQPTSRFTRWQIHALVAALATVAFVAAPGVANAAPPTTDDSSLESCLIIVSTGEKTCAATPAELTDTVEAIYQVDLDKPLAGSGAVAPSTSARAGTDALSEVTAAAAATLYVRTRLYDNSNYGGAVYVLADYDSCATPGTVKISNLASVGWNDRVSSFKSVTGCVTKIWVNSGYSGTSLGYTASSSYVGSTLNDKASSVSTK